MMALDCSYSFVGKAMLVIACAAFSPMTCQNKRLFKTTGVRPAIRCLCTYRPRRTHRAEGEATPWKEKGEKERGRGRRARRG